MMHSTRFDLPAGLTEHARLRMAEREIDADRVLEIIDTGTLKDAGGSHYWLYKHQPDDFKPMPNIGKGVEEIRIWDGSGTCRVVYTARLANAVIVLHAFQ